MEIKNLKKIMEKNQMYGKALRCFQANPTLFVKHFKRTPVDQSAVRDK